MDKGLIISQAFLKVGENNIFNDNKSDKYLVAEQLLERVSNNLAVDADYLFNSITTKLTSIGKNELGEYRFNLPIDYLNIIRGNEPYRIEGEFLYSPSSTVYIQYSRKISFSEIPSNMYSLIVVALAKELSIAFSAYNSRFSLLQQQLDEERRKILYEQGFMYRPWEGE